jgi:hypothetical protein
LLTASRGGNGPDTSREKNPERTNSNKNEEYPELTLKKAVFENMQRC